MSELGSNRLAILAADIRTAHRGVESAAIARAGRALEAGRALIEAKTLLKHGRWLPWLEEHCGLPERTAQLYMKLAKLDLLPEMIAALGLEKAAQTEAPNMMGTAPDYLTRYSELMQREWLLFALFVGSYEHAEWCMRKDYGSPDEWLADDKTCRAWGMEHPAEGFKAAWSTYRLKHAGTSRASVEAMLTSAAAA